MLHQNALQLSVEAFGINNVQTAKHYGNLGRLYQSMHQFERAEDMHKKAIAIKEKLLGEGDYEVMKTRVSFTQDESFTKARPQ